MWKIHPGRTNSGGVGNAAAFLCSDLAMEYGSDPVCGCWLRNNGDVTIQGQVFPDPERQFHRSCYQGMGPLDGETPAMHSSSTEGTLHRLP